MAAATRAAARAAAAATRAATSSAPAARAPRGRAVPVEPPPADYVLAVDAFRTAANGPLVLRVALSKASAASPLFAGTYQVEEYP
jgi:hypothetical protein